MTDKIDVSKGRYWDRAWSLVEGCTPVSAACDHCWLARIEYTYKPHLHVTKFQDTGKIAFTGLVKCNESRKYLPASVKKPTVWAIWSDLFHESVPDSFISEAYMVMRMNPRHTFLVLTKRPERMADFLSEYSPLPPHIWSGTTVENQKAAGDRIIHLLRICSNTFLSVEPMLGPIDVSPYLIHSGGDGTNSLNIHAVICGGQSGPGWRRMEEAWAISLRLQCQKAGVPFFFKQNSGGVEKNGRLLCGRTYDALPWVPKEKP